MTWNIIKLNKITKITKNVDMIRMKRNEKTRSKSKRKSSWCRRKMKLKGIGSLIDSD